MYVFLIMSSPMSSAELADSRCSFNIYHMGIDNYYETFNSSLSRRAKPPHPSHLLKYFLWKLKKNFFFGKY